MTKDQITITWTKYPNGKIPTGTFCPSCARYNVRCSTVEVIMLNERKEVLFIRRAAMPQQGWWSLPGGYVDWGERLEQTAKREVKEETGLDVSTITFFRLYDNPARDLDGRQNIGHCFIATYQGVLTANEEEATDIQWFPLHQLPENVAFDHRTMLDDYAKTL
ncbi:MAG: NUDIX hydrolase [Candidatus Pacebacteria bacterium]|nr:NUDIX hydrolase [Candidatus Paceibacterota bacterium]